MRNHNVSEGARASACGNPDPDRIESLTMASYLDSVPFSGIIRIRDMMYSVKDPFRLDQGDVSFDAPDTVKRAMHRAIDENKTHYLQTTGLPALLELMADKLRRVNGIPIGGTDEVMVTTGGIHALYIICQALLEPGDEVIVPDPEWPPCVGNILAAHAVPMPCPLHERLDWRFDLEELESKITPRTRAIYVNSPNNPTGGVLSGRISRAISALATRARALADFRRGLRGCGVRRHHARQRRRRCPACTNARSPFYTFSKSYAMTGLRLGYVAAKDAKLRERMKKVLFYTASNIASVVQYGGVGALEGSQDFDRGIPRRTAGAPRFVLRRRAGARGGNAQRHAPQRGVLRIPAHRPELAARRRFDPPVDLLGDDGIPDLEGPYRLRSWRRFRRPG